VIDKKHTPGPITVKGNTQPWQGYYLYNEEDDCLGGTAFDCEADKANANLWAAAPELLAACELFVDAFVDYHGHHEREQCPVGNPNQCEYCAARSAIAKAKG
jgi:hypothetical protein